MTVPLESRFRLRIASPCHVGWENMDGDDRVRHCEQCSLNVYNFSELSSEEVVSLIAKTEGRICARLYRRPDGTVLTKDCPVGLRALRRRISRRASAILAAVIAATSAVVGQTKTQQDEKPSSETFITQRTANQNEATVFSGTVVDHTGAVITGAHVELTDQGGKVTEATSNDDGRFKIVDLAAGEYVLTIVSPGFKNFKVKGLELSSKETLNIDATLKVSSEGTVTVGVLISEPSIEYSNGTLRVSGDYIRRLPLN